MQLSMLSADPCGRELTPGEVVAVNPDRVVLVCRECQSPFPAHAGWRPICALCWWRIRQCG